MDLDRRPQNSMIMAFLENKTKIQKGVFIFLVLLFISFIYQLITLKQEVKDGFFIKCENGSYEFFKNSTDYSSAIIVCGEIKTKPLTEKKEFFSSFSMKKLKFIKYEKHNFNKWYQTQHNNF